jgi:hypothetical protein
MHSDFYNHYIENKTKNNETTNIIDPINKQYHVIVFSHYPMFCSKGTDDLQTCQ